MAYQALYRTWRPATFADVVGQERVVTTLLNQIRMERTPHAYLFCGSRGTGKTSVAKVLARAVNCTNLNDGEPCGECEVCRSILEERNLDVAEIDAASNNGVENVRELIDKIKYPPSSCRKKVYIIDEVHMLSTSAFNALLKTLEEPPAHALFILATTDPQKLPATILSRCQRFDFRRIPAALIEGRLRQVLASQNMEAEDEAISLIARAAEGGMRDALSILDMCLSYGHGALTAGLAREVLGASDRSFLFDFTQALIDGDAARAFEMIDTLMREGRDPAVFAREVTGHARGLLVTLLCGGDAADILEVTPEDARRMLAQAQSATQARLTRLMDLFIQAENDMKWASQQRSVLELCAVRACHPERENGAEAWEDLLDALEKAVRSGAVAVRPAQAAEKPAAAIVAEAAPAATPKETSGPAPDDAQAYDKGLKDFSKEDPRGWTMLRKAHFDGVTGDVVHVSYDEPGCVSYIDLLSGDERAALINRCMSGVFGRNVTLKASLKTAAPTPEDKAKSRDHLDRIYAAFGRESVELSND